jgi:hypothetical protein
LFETVPTLTFKSLALAKRLPSRLPRSHLPIPAPVSISFRAPHTPQDHLPLKVAALELDHRPSSHEAVGADVTRRRSQPKICDRTY